jgi:hypothetical protein
MTGATGVHLLVWSDDRHDWLLPTSGGGPTPVSGTGHEHELPTSVPRYVQRTGEPLVVSDATTDDRFLRDPYFTDLTCCSLLVVPILSRGSARAAGKPAAARRVHRRPARRCPAHRRPARRLPGQRPAVRRAHHVAGADRRRRRPRPATDRARPARRRPAATGLAGPAAARGPSGGTARLPRAGSAAGLAGGRGDQRAGRVARANSWHPPDAAGRGRAGPGAGRARSPQHHPRRAERRSRGPLA